MAQIIVSGYVYPNVSPEVLSVTAPNLTFLSLFTYGITADGDLVQLDDEDVIQQIEPYNVGALMVVTAMDTVGRFNNQATVAVINDPVRSERLIGQILENIQTKGMQGVDFDFEYLPPEEREAYAAFVANTRERLNPFGYTVMVALAPKTYATQPGLLYESHDYSLMGAAANYVLLMTYEWGYGYGPPMAVAPINKVREVLDYAVTEIPREKILMGIPNYGYDWILPFQQGGPRAETVTNVEAVARAARYGATIQWDPVAEAPWYNYADSEGRQREVWFENAFSIRAKLNLVAEYGLAGISYWNLMNYFPASWEVLNSMFTVMKVK